MSSTKYTIPSSTKLVCSVGLELELNNISGTAKDVEFLKKAFADNGKHHLPGWIVKTDGSCGLRGAGVEIVSPILRTEEDLRGVVKVCQALSRLGFKVNHKCGLHVHIGVEGLSPAQRDRLIKFFIRYENGFYLFDPSRHDNTYCGPLPSGIIKSAKDGGGWTSWTGRYHWLNGQSFSKHRTAELRLMSGSTNENHIIGWVSFLLHVYDQCVNQKLDVGPWEPLVAQTGDTDGASLLKTMLGAARLHDKFEDMSQRKRAAVALAWAEYRYQEVHGFSEIARVRAERKARLLAAMKHKVPFVPIFSPVPTVFKVDEVTIPD